MLRNERRNYEPKKASQSQSQKKKKKNATTKDKRPLLLFRFTDFE